jgi:hypothetical protein
VITQPRVELLGGRGCGNLNRSFFDRSQRVTERVFDFREERMLHNIPRLVAGVGEDP